MSEMTPLDYLTAEPTLRLMVAMAGHDPVEGFAFRDAWPVFKQFLSLPSRYAHDIAGFQFLVPSEDHTEPAPWAQLVREFRWEPGDRNEPGIRRVLVVFPNFDLDEQGAVRQTAVEGEQQLVLWSDQYPDIAAFTAAVEATAQFRMLMDAGFLDGVIQVEVGDPADE